MDFRVTIGLPELIDSGQISWTIITMVIVIIIIIVNI